MNWLDFDSRIGQTPKVWARTLTASEQLDPDAVPPGEEEEGEMPEVMPTVLSACLAQRDAHRCEDARR